MPLGESVLRCASSLANDACKSAKDSPVLDAAEDAALEAAELVTEDAALLEALPAGPAVNW